MEDHDATSSRVFGALPPSYINHYCLYRKDDINPILGSPGGSAKLKDLRSDSLKLNFSSKTMQQQLQGTEDSTDYVRLEVEYTDLATNDELNVRRYISHKANRNLVSSNGQIGVLPGLFSSAKISGTIICYYALLQLQPSSSHNSSESNKFDTPYGSLVINRSSIRPESPIERESLNRSREEADTLEKSPAMNQDYIICFICEVLNDEGFALFKHDMDIFSEKIKLSLYKVKIRGKPSDVLKDQLAGWYAYNIDYVNRCIDMLKEEKLATILHTAIQGKSIVVVKKPSRAAFVEDIARFIKAATLNTNIGGQNSDADMSSRDTTSSFKRVVRVSSSISEVSVIDESLASTIKTDNSTLVMTVDAEYVLHLNCSGSNQFCVEWAQELRSAGRDPLKLRNIIEHQKYKVVQELSQLRRLIDQAKMNNYSLYKMYKTLTHNNNGDVLLHILRAENQSDTDAMEVLEVIEKSLKPSPPSSEELPSYMNANSDRRL